MGTGEKTKTTAADSFCDAEMFFLAVVLGRESVYETERPSVLNVAKTLKNLVCRHLSQGVYQNIMECVH